MTTPQVPFFRPDIGESEIGEVVATLRSGWLTTGPKVRSFEESFKAAVNARYALAVNSCTAGLHLALEALGIGPGDAVLVPTLTFAATAEVVRYLGAVPVLVDCDPVTLNMDLKDAAAKIERLTSGRTPGNLPQRLSVKGMIPVHVAGLMMDVDAVRQFASEHGLWVVDDAAHAFPAAWRRSASQPWQQCGEGTAAISCFSFYANKTITTGEGGMIVTNDRSLAERMRLMALHGLSADAWSRYSGKGSWDYQIVAPGFKYNLTDISAAIGIHQLARAEEMRRQREQIARRYVETLLDVEEIELPPDPVDRVHSWHLFPIKLKRQSIDIDRSEFIRGLNRLGVGASVHWRPLHLHPYYRQTFDWRPDDCPVASAEWERLVSLPIFSSMHDWEVDHVAAAVRALCQGHNRATLSSPRPEHVMNSATAAL
jgi:dTDP-4-amino-4,6-dideoxygalactose transaminase